MSFALIILLVVFILLVLIDAPIAVALGLASMSYLLVADMAPVMVAAQKMISGIDSFTLLAIPLFLFAGLLMVHGGLAPRILAFCMALVGKGPGGPAIVMIIACMLFGSLSGSGVADVIAIGTMMLPALKDQGYAPGFSAAALGCAGSLGSIIPPSIVLIVYGTVTNTSIGQLFVAAILPGLMLTAGLIVVAWRISKRQGWSGGEEFSWARLGQTIPQSFLALLAPVIIVGGIRGGFFTATEAAAVGVAYATFVGAVIYRNLSFGLYFKLLRETAETTGAILIIIASASVFGWILAVEHVPQLAVSFVTASTANATIALLIMMVLILVLGTFMESLAIILILAPVFMPVLAEYQIDPVYFGILLAVNLAIGANTPPLGITAMAACRTGGIPLSASFPFLMPFLGSMVLVLGLLVIFPQVVMVLPGLLK